MATRFVNIDLEEIFEDNPDGVYDSPDTETRSQISGPELEDFPYVNDHGQPIHIYSQDGHLIQRRLGIFSTTSKPHGILVKSERLQNLFIRDFDEFDDSGSDDGMNLTIPFTFYPQAGLRTVGHFQAKGLVAPCYPIIAKINHSIQMGLRENNSAASRRVIHGISSQGYNAVTHHTRGRTAQHHDVQVGLVTGSLAGAWAVESKTIQTAQRLQKKCDHKMPHSAYAQKIDNPNICRDLRLENVYWIDMDALSDEQQNGGLVISTFLSVCWYWGY